VSVEDYVAELRRVLSLLPMDALRHTQQLLAESRDELATTAHGSQAPDLHHATAAMDHGRARTVDVHRLLVEAQQAIERYLAHIGAPAPASEPFAATAPVKRAARPDPEPAADRVQRMLDELPEPVPKPNPTGKKTHGRIVGDPAAEVIVSGVDDYSAEAWRLLLAAGLSPKFKPMSVNHVEMKVAVRMIQTGRRTVEIALNNEPCAGFLSCRALLPVILPQGYTITVHGPNYHGVFTGGQKWSS
jgi:hypothetical protein